MRTDPATRKMKTPPDRSGITFEIGAHLEARDRHKTWHSAAIEKIDYDKERVLVHYHQWSRRHDQWFPWNSLLLRPLEGVSLRRRALNEPRLPPLFSAGVKVLACWTDCRFYPAKILRVNKDDSYTVRFFDGVVRTVKPTKVKPFQEKVQSEKSAVGSEGWEEEESEEEEEEEEEEGAEERDGEENKEEENEGEEEEKRRQEEPSSTHPPVKKRTGDGGGSQPIRSESTLQLPPHPAHISRDILLERQAHLPTTHKFSREPLYRVIKNQPPPILSIELDHNPFKCPAPGCTKSFRKASLLHYHIKYYHSDQQLDQRGGEPDTHRRKRSSSEGADILFDNSITCYHDNREQDTMETEVKKDGGREKAGSHDKKERKNLLRVKLKKKKKKKKKSHLGPCSSEDENSDRPPITFKMSADPHSHLTPVDEGSDWSTLTAESGEDTPTWPVAMETEECEVVRCVCEVEEENDFMIQCDSCLCWQHGTCMGLYEDNVPHKYTCYYCRHTAGWSRVQRHLLEPDWLVSGHMFGLSCVRENYSEINASNILTTSHLLAHTHGLNQVLRGLQLKISLLHSPSHPDLQLWRLPWRWEEESHLTSQRGEPTVCYVSSEHCYQKPGASWEMAEERENAKQDQSPDQEMKCYNFSKKPSYVATRGEPRPSTVAECQLNLLDHVESVHQQISARMDLIERELDVLESWSDHSGDLEPPDPLSRLPQLKQRIRGLLRDLCTVRRLSVCC